jgi:ABC-type branched-subunit amino acid transport system ATPase component
MLIVKTYMCINGASTPSRGWPWSERGEIVPYNGSNGAGKPPSCTPFPASQVLPASTCLGNQLRARSPTRCTLGMAHVPEGRHVFSV